MWIKSEPIDEESIANFYKQPEGDVSIVKTEPSIVDSYIEGETEDFSIECEVTFDEFENIPSPILSSHRVTEPHLRNKETSGPEVNQRKRNLFSCECGKQFNQRSSLNRHKLFHTRKKSYSCDNCEEKFATKSVLNKHKKVHAMKSNVKSERETVSIKSEITSNDYECNSSSDIVALQTSNEGKLAKKTVHERTYSCDKCEAKFVRKRTLLNHQQSHSGVKSLHICDICGNTFIHKHSLKAHIRSHSGLKPYACEDCGMRFNKNYSLTLHKVTHTGEKHFACDECGMRFAQKSYVNIHKRIHTGEKRFACGECGMRFSRRSAVTSHNLTHTGERRFPCGQCGKAFTKQCHLDTHKLQHSGERPFVCDVDGCGKGFTRKFYLKSHKLQHSGVKAFPCDECSSKFGTRSLLNQHKRIHSRKSTIKGKSKTKPETTFQLSSKSIMVQSTKDKLQEPSVEHYNNDIKYGESLEKSSGVSVDIKPIVSLELELGKRLNEEKQGTSNATAEQLLYCGEFGKIYVETSGLHQPVHIDHPVDPNKGVIKIAQIPSDNIVRIPRSRLVEKPFSCSECEEKFGTESRLKIHQRVHTGENIFVCDECGKSYNRGDTLVKHKRLHTGKKDYGCDICKMTFLHKSTMKTHILRHAGVKLFACDQCPSRFVTGFGVTQHKRHSHRVKPTRNTMQGITYTSTME